MLRSPLRPKVSPSTQPLINTAALRRLRTWRAVEDALGILFSLATLVVTLTGLLMAVADDAYAWMQILPMMLVAILSAVMLCYFIASFCVTFAKPRSRFTSFFSDFLWLAPSTIVWIAFASFSSWAIHRWPHCGEARVQRLAAGICPLTRASMAFAWICAVLTVILLVLRYRRYHRVLAPIKASLTELGQLYPAPMGERETGEAGRMVG